MYLQSAAASYIYIHYALKKSGDVTCSCSAHRPHLFRPYPNISLMRRANTYIPPNKPEQNIEQVLLRCSVRGAVHTVLLRYSVTSVDGP